MFYNRLQEGDAMPGQMSFSLDHPVSHRHDPVTSKEAERAVTDSGARKSNNRTVWELVCRYPNLTASELTIQALQTDIVFYNMGYDKALIEVRRRLSDMLCKRMLVQGDVKHGLLKKQEVTWRVR